MLDDFIVDKRGLHRRVAGVRKPLQHRVFTPTAVFTPFPSDPTDPTTTTDQPPGNQLPTGLLPPIPDPSSTTSTDPLLPNGPIGFPTTTTDILTTTSSTTPSSSTTSTSSSTLVAPTVLPPTTSSSTTSLLPTSTPQPTTEVQVTITQSQSFTTSATSLAASPTASTTAKSSVSSGVLIGGILAVVIAVAGIVFAVVYFIRRNRKAGDDDFNPDEFRRHSVMLPNDDDASGFSRAMTWNQGGARPPTMIEQKLSYNSASYVPPMPAHPYGYGAAYNQPSFSPGQLYSPTTPNSANPFFSPYDHSPMAFPAPPDTFYDAQGNVVSAHPSMVSSNTVLSRHTSTGSNKPLPDVAVEGEYVDMSRSSVTPFQAAQYADISRHLNLTPPQGLPLMSATEEHEHAPEIPVPDVPSKNITEALELRPGSIGIDGQHLAVEPTLHENAFSESPFADPVMTEQQQQRLSQRESTDWVLQPPAAALSSSPKARIPSIPPMLPELTILERSFSPVTMEFPTPPSTIGRPEPQPSLSSSEIPSPPPNVHFPDAPVPPRARASEPTPYTGTEAPAIVKRPETVYDDEDAYAGI